MGYRTAAVYSQADAEALHVRTADVAACIGPPEAQASYLDTEAILGAARRLGADAVHPGYGFLSENADFARACAEADLVFIGPSAEAIAAMGNKAEAKRRMASLTFNVGYTWGNTISDAADNGNDGAGTIENPFDRRSERAREAYAMQHRFVGSTIWQIPVGRGRPYLSSMPHWAITSRAFRSLASSALLVSR